MEIDYLNTNEFSPVKLVNNQFVLKISPFIYLDGRKPRLPRKSSRKYKLTKDTNFYFSYIFRKINTKADNSKFKVNLNVNCGSDRLGTADLNNYCKAIIDGITKTQKV